MKKGTFADAHNILCALCILFYLSLRATFVIWIKKSHHRKFQHSQSFSGASKLPFLKNLNHHFMQYSLPLISLLIFLLVSLNSSLYVMQFAYFSHSRPSKMFSNWSWSHMLPNTAFYRVSKELLSIHSAYCSNGFSFSYGSCITQQSCCLIKLVIRKINLSVYVCACISLLFWKMTVTVVTISKSLKWLLCNEQFPWHCTHRVPPAFNPWLRFVCCLLFSL